MGAQKNHLIEMVLLSTHNMFRLRNKKNYFYIKAQLTPCPRTLIIGITFSLAMVCKTLGGPYKLPIHADTDEMYKPVSHSTPTTDTWGKKIRNKNQPMQIRKQNYTVQTRGANCSMTYVVYKENNFIKNTKTTL